MSDFVLIFTTLLSGVHSLLSHEALFGLTFRQILLGPPVFCLLLLFLRIVFGPVMLDYLSPPEIPEYKSNKKG